jgi:hypothetical protein
VDVTEVCGGDWSSMHAGSQGRSALVGVSAEASEAGLGEPITGCASGFVSQSIHWFFDPGFAKLPHGQSSLVPQWSYSYRFSPASSLRASVYAAALVVLAAKSSQSSLKIFSALSIAALRSFMSLIVVASWIAL